MTPQAQKPRPLPPEVLTALQRGNLIDAIKLLRASGGFDLKQAKDAIEAQLGRNRESSGRFGTPQSDPQVTDALRKGNRTEAIRILHEKGGLDLKDARDTIDGMQLQTRAPAPRSRLSPGEVPQSGEGKWVVAVLIAAAVIAYFYLTR